MKTKALFDLIVDIAVMHERAEEYIRLAVQPNTGFRKSREFLGICRK